MPKKEDTPLVKCAMSLIRHQRSTDETTYEPSSMATMARTDSPSHAFLTCRMAIDLAHRGKNRANIRIMPDSL
jgi:hypothetical protein